MRMKLLIILFIFFSCQNKKGEINNIEITNKVFLELLQNFNKSHCKSDNNIMSVSVWINGNDTTVGLYANKKLKTEYYIGYKKNAVNEIYFYSNYKGSIQGLYNLISAPMEKIDSIWDFRETYTEFYYYKNGKFELEK
jgi:hypothetical protein